MPRLLSSLLSVCALLLSLAGCTDSGPQSNPSSLWINYSMREIDLVLVDYEPPPF
jgi:hypothetical protein